MKIRDFDIKFSRVIVILLIGIVLASTIVYAVTDTQPFTINRGIYPGASSFTVWEEDDVCYAKNNFGIIIQNSPDFDVVTNAAIALLTNGGTIFVAEGNYSQAGTVTVTEGVTIKGECWGDDAVNCVKIERTTDATMFDFTGDHIKLQNLYLVGNAAYTSTFITFGEDPSRYNEVDSVTLSTGDCYGIDLESSYWCTVSHIRGLFLGNYLIISNPGSGMVGNKFDDIIGYHCDGLIYLYVGVGCELSRIMTDYYDGMTNYLIRLEAGMYFVHDIDLEGDVTAGIPINCISQAGGIAYYTNCRFYYCGDPATTYSVFGFTDNAEAHLDSCHFEGTLGWKEVYATAGCNIYYSNMHWDLGPSVTYMAITVSFSDGTDPDDEGFIVDGGGDEARVWLQVPGYVKRVEGIRVWAGSVGAEADHMQAGFVMHGATDNEAYNTHSYSDGAVASASSNFAANDIIYWDLTDSAILALTGGDSVMLNAIYAAADGDDCATNCMFRAIELLYS